MLIGMQPNILCPGCSVCGGDLILHVCHLVCLWTQGCDDWLYTNRTSDRSDIIRVAGTSLACFHGGPAVRQLCHSVNTSKMRNSSWSLCKSRANTCSVVTYAERMKVSQTPHIPGQALMCEPGAGVSETWPVLLWFE